MKASPDHNKELRTGYTTGACATAATGAATYALMHQEPIEQYTITLPQGESVTFSLQRCNFNETEATCSVIKDAGDDPDVTHGAEIGSTVTFNQEGKIRLLQGEGVGKVTLEGLDLPVGAPAINAVPQRMIRKVAEAEWPEANLDIRIFVPEGEKIARKTLNPRIGILGGISILGTTGIVKPYSASSYIASIRQSMDVALQSGCHTLILNSGKKSENFVRDHFPNHPEHAFIQYGNWIGEALQKANEIDVKELHIILMLGKAVKLAEGHLDTSSRKATVNPAFLKTIGQEAGMDENTLTHIEQLSMARGLPEKIPFETTSSFYQLLGGHCYRQCRTILEKNTDLYIYLLSNDGQVLPVDTSYQKENS